MMEINNKTLGGLTIVTSIVLFFLLIWFVDAMSDMSRESCTCGESCDMNHFEVPALFYAGIAGVVIVFVVGLNLALKKPPEKPGREKWVKTLEKLDSDMKTAYKELVDADGALFQSEIVEKTGFSKAKVTRILDKMESRNLAERRRRGLANIVVLK